MKQVQTHSKHGLRVFHILAGLRIWTKLAIGFGVVMLITAAIGLMAMRSMDTLSGFTVNLYEHPFTVTRSLLEARVEINGNPARRARRRRYD